jgi:N-carbamoyl-L-amino-acid hydrolase
VISIDGQQLLERIREFGRAGRNTAGTLSRVALTDQDAAGRDLLVRWMEEAGLQVQVDRIGNIFGTLCGVGSPPDAAALPIMMGSHIDTVVDAGIYDGAYGVLAGIEVARTLQAAGTAARRPLTVVAFTNEEGIRYTPDMMGSLVHAGGLSLKDALSTVGPDGSVLAEELARIGYAGSLEPGTIRPLAFVELHVEQGPVLFREEAPIGAVEAVQAISWQQIDVRGHANHAGTTPMSLRRDAAYAASRIVSILPVLAAQSGGDTVATAGQIELEPNAINVIAGRATV